MATGNPYLSRAEKARERRFSLSVVLLMLAVFFSRNRKLLFHRWACSLPPRTLAEDLNPYKNQNQPSLGSTLPSYQMQGSNISAVHHAFTQRFNTPWLKLNEICVNKFSAANEIFLVLLKFRATKSTNVLGALWSPESKNTSRFSVSPSSFLGYPIFPQNILRNSSLAVARNKVKSFHR